LPDKPLTKRFRLLGFVPLIAFLAQALHYWEINQFGQLLWMCNVGTLLLAFALFFNQPVLIRVAVIWAIPGLFVWWRYVVMEWFYYATLDWWAVFSSTLAHISSLVIGLLALRHIRADRWAWLSAFAWYLAMQFISRLATPADLNVNVSHHIYQGWQIYFSSYLRFWLVLTALVAGSLWLLGLILNKLWPLGTTIPQPDELNSSVG
jgi:hypothetical protein